MQLRAMRVSSVRYFTEPSDRNSLTPYFDVIQRATKLAGVAFEVTRLGQEQPMSDWRNIMSRAEQAKRLLNADRHRGEEEFASMLLQFPSDGMIYLKRGEAYEAIGEVRTAASDFERAAALLPMEKWKAIARDALARCAVRAMPQVMSDPPSLSQDTFSDLPSELRDFWRDALGAPTQLPVAQVALQRLAVERSVVHLLRVRTIQVPPRSGLSEQIRLLQENGAVTAATIAHLHTMRSLGNEAAHGGKIGEDELEACRVAANAILKALRAALA
jgi:tetratricopeptide (TPR) repeat protein